METANRRICTADNGSYCIYTRKAPWRVAKPGPIQKDRRGIGVEGVPFDFKFDHTTPDALYCTEMVVGILKPTITSASPSYVNIAICISLIF